MMVMVRGFGVREVWQQLPTNLVSVSNCNWSWKLSLLVHRYTKFVLWYKKEKSLTTLKQIKLEIQMSTV